MDDFTVSSDTRKRVLVVMAAQIKRLKIRNKGMERTYDSKGHVLGVPEWAKRELSMAEIQRDWYRHFNVIVPGHQLLAAFPEQATTQTPTREPKPRTRRDKFDGVVRLRGGGA